MQLTLGQIYADKYRIVRLLGEGAMGAVYEAENTRIRRRVAIKLLHPQIAQKADTLRRFEREAQAAGRIGSQHIVEVLDFGELADGSRFMVLEYLDGTTLDQRIRSRGRLTPEEATPIVTQLLEGLGAAHKAEIIHRDLKPANVYLCPRPSGVDFVKILDFGVSKFNVLNDEMSMTSTGAVLGTPYYMSPEQAKGSRQIDSRSDLYAVGVILYECITGQVPFSAETFNELIFRIVLESPPPVESFVPNLDPAFTAIIHKAMAREAGARFQTAEEFRAILQYWGERAAAGPVVLGALAANGTQLMDPAARGGPELDLDNARTIAIEGKDRVSVPPWTPGSAAPLGPLPAPRAPPVRTQALPSFEVAPAAQPPAFAPAQGGEAPPAIPVVPAEAYAIPKQRSSVVAFVGGLLAVLVIGGGVVALVKLKAGRSVTTTTTTTMTTATAVTTAAVPSAIVAAPLPQGTVVAAPTSAPVAAGTVSEPSSAGARSGGAARTTTPSATPSATAKSGAKEAGSTPPSPSGKRTVSNEL
jgi:eukaryotic-like serine/threonine-protein kinase